MKSIDLGRLGFPGIVGLGLLLFCLSFYFGSVSPLDDEVDQRKNEEARLLATLRSGARPATPVVAAPQPLTLRDAPALLLNLSATADQHSVSIERAAYRISEQEGRRRLEVTLPLKGNYPSLRAYLRDVLSKPPVTLEELSLKRPTATEALLDAQVRLSYPLAGA